VQQRVLWLATPVVHHRFGRSGDLAELHEHHQIDAESVVGAALDLLD
jgi:pyruvate dehydrogenase complex dehydrogenase (E1) component